MALHYTLAPYRTALLPGRDRVINVFNTPLRVHAAPRAGDGALNFVPSLAQERAAAWIVPAQVRERSDCRQSERWFTMIPIPPKFAGRAAISPEEAAELLGVDRSTVYRQIMPYVYSGTIASLKIGSCRRLLVASLLQWVESQAQEKVA